MPTEQIIPLRIWDMGSFIKSTVLEVSLKFDHVLDCSKLQGALDTLLALDGGKQVGARLRMKNGKLEYHIPAHYDSARPGYDFSITERPMRIEAHEIACHLPVLGDQPVLLPLPDELSPDGNPITAYNPPSNKGQPVLGGWMSPTDPRSRIALHMNWTGQTLPFLVYGARGLKNNTTPENTLPQPSTSEIEAISPAAQIRLGNYNTPTFLIHGTRDDLIPVAQVKRTAEDMKAMGVEVQLRVLQGAVHLFDVGPGYEEDADAGQAVADGY
ncbi:hypothetical protein BDW74DRAFT_180797 [Aspergillus multicolor]|uniref:dienelactone hydrolase family protein n=1 Tax=Aspergillus multicolor TaxID=41759 RepID=UPI003CCE4EDF